MPKITKSELIRIIGMEYRNAIHCDNCKGVPLLEENNPKRLLSCPFCIDRIAEQVLKTIGN